jgi:FixJ family two-component response regulator
MMRGDHMIDVVDDDRGVRLAVDNLLGSHGFSARTFGSAADYLKAPKLNVPGCLVLDLKLPDVSGLDLQRQLDGPEDPPIVFITGHGDVPSSVRAIKEGAVDFLPKPFSQEALLAAVESALIQHHKRRVAVRARNQLLLRYASLTAREREVLTLIVSGMLNKQAATRLGISVVTLQIHRGRVMRKMAARSFAALVRMALTLSEPIDFNRFVTTNAQSAPPE